MPSLLFVDVLCISETSGVCAATETKKQKTESNVRAEEIKVCVHLCVTDVRYLLWSDRWMQLAAQEIKTSSLSLFVCVLSFCLQSVFRRSLLTCDGFNTL